MASISQYATLTVWQTLVASGHYSLINYSFIGVGDTAQVLSAYLACKKSQAWCLPPVITSLHLEVESEGLEAQDQPSHIANCGLSWTTWNPSPKRGKIGDYFLTY